MSIESEYLRDICKELKKLNQQLADLFNKLQLSDFFKIGAPEKESTTKEEDGFSVTNEFECMIASVTDKAVKAIIGNNYSWIPKKCIANLDKIVVQEGKNATLIIQEWFINKIEWKVIK